MYHVPQEYWIPAKEGMDRALVKLQLQFTQEERPLTGDRALRSRSITTYESHFRGLRYFFCLVGDYESLLMLQPKAPTPFCPSLNADGISDFIRYKRGIKGTQLLNKLSQPVLDIFGNPILCQGAWCNP